MTKGTKAYFDALLSEFNRAEKRKNDPVSFVYRYKTKKDKEIAGFIAACFAYGRVEKILQSVSLILKPLGASPYKTITDSKKRYEEIYKIFSHRFNNGADAAALLYALKDILKKHGSLENLFKKKLKDGIKEALKSFAGEIRSAMEKAVEQKKLKIKNAFYLVPEPSKNSPCKRLNLFLRWMIRKDGVDPGVWRSLKDLKKDLIVPVDAHILKCALDIGAVKNKNVSWQTAEKITAYLKKYDPRDPLKYDFAICHSGIQRNKLTKKDK